jgi:hypothetical protein
VQLDYQVHERAPGQIVFEGDSQRHTLTFPLTPRWMIILSIVAPFSFGTLQFAAAAQMAWFQWSFSRSLGMPIFSLWPAIFLQLVGGMFWMAFAWFPLRSYRRYGHLPRQLSLDAGKGTLNHRGERSARRREWLVSELRSARLSPMRNPLGRPAGGKLSICLRRWPFWINVRCRESDLPQVRAFAQQLFRQLPPDLQRPADDESNCGHSTLFPDAPPVQPPKIKK